MGYFPTFAAKLTHYPREKMRICPVKWHLVKLAALEDTGDIPTRELRKGVARDCRHEGPAKNQKKRKGAQLREIPGRAPSANVEGKLRLYIRLGPPLHQSYQK